MKRDSDYYKARLKREFPAIYAELKAGSISSVRQAAIRANLVKPASRVRSLKREWTRATVAERKEFLMWAKSSATTSKRAGAAGKSIAIVDASGRLKPAVIDVLSAWLKARNKRPGNIMQEMGFRNYDWRLKVALDGKTLKREISDKLSVWLKKSGVGV